MKYTLFLLALICVPVAHAQLPENTPGVTTTISPDSRYEIILSNFMAQHAFRLDRMGGSVYILVVAKDGTFVWQLMHRGEHSEPVHNGVGKVNYQIAISGILAKNILLMNVVTGATWILTQDPKTEELWWAPIRSVL